MGQGEMAGVAVQGGDLGGSVRVETPNFSITALGRAVMAIDALRRARGIAPGDDELDECTRLAEMCAPATLARNEDDTRPIVSGLRLDQNVDVGAAAGVGHDRLTLHNRGFKAGELLVAGGDGVEIRNRLLDLNAVSVRRMVRGLAFRLATWRARHDLVSLHEVDVPELDDLVAQLDKLAGAP